MPSLGLQPSWEDKNHTHKTMKPPRERGTESRWSVSIEKSSTLPAPPATPTSNYWFSTDTITLWALAACQTLTGCFAFIFQLMLTGARSGGHECPCSKKRDTRGTWILSYWSKAPTRVIWSRSVWLAEPVSLPLPLFYSRHSSVPTF